MRPEEMPNNCEALDEFAAGRTGWTVHVDSDGLYAGRRYEFPGGQQALLSVYPVSRDRGGVLSTPLARRISRRWQGQLSMPFSAGSEVAHAGSFAEVTEWLRRQERALQFVEALHNAGTFDEAVQMAAALTREQRETLAVALETRTLPASIAVACRPGARKEVKSRG